MAFLKGLKDIGNAVMQEVDDSTAMRLGLPATVDKVDSARAAVPVVQVPYHRCLLCGDAWITTKNAFFETKTSNFTAFRVHFWQQHGVAIMLKSTNACVRAQRRAFPDARQTQLTLFAPPTQQENLANTALRCIVENSLPISIVENEAWREMVMAAATAQTKDGKKVTPKHPLQTPRMVRRNLATAFGMILKRLKERLASVKGYSLSLDGWRSGRKNIQSLHVYALDSQGNPQAPQLIAMLPIRGSHTASHVADVIRMGLRRAGLDAGPGGPEADVDPLTRPAPKLLALTSDGASNMSATAAQLNVPWIHCCAHALNLAVQVSHTPQHGFST